MTVKETAEKLIDSYQTAHFALGHVLYDRDKERINAVRNANIIVDLQISVLDADDPYSVAGVENFDKSFWEDVKKEINS